MNEYINHLIDDMHIDDERPTTSYEGEELLTKSLLKQLVIWRGPAFTEPGLQALPTDNDVFITRRDLCSYLPVSMSTLNRWASNNEGPAYIKYGRMAVYRVGSIRDWLESNTHGLRKDNTSGERGVYWDGVSRWMAFGYKNKERIYIGRYGTIKDAAQARRKWKDENRVV